MSFIPDHLSCDRLVLFWEMQVWEGLYSVGKMCVCSPGVEELLAIFFLAALLSLG